MSTGTAISSRPETFDPLTNLEARCDTKRNWMTRCFQHTVIRKLSRIRTGQICLNDQCDQIVLGNSDHPTLRTVVTVNNPDFYRRIALGGSLGAAEAYIDGSWDCDDLPALIRIFTADRLTQGNRDTRLHRIANAAARLGHRLARNTREGSRRNISAHYDLGNDFFRLFLDETMMYSAGMYDSPESTLEEAQKTRLDRICRQLDLTPDDHVLEIGTGWGGCAIHLARTTGCRVTTTTISEQQYRYACELVAAAGLNSRITVLKQDYRDLSGKFDRIVSLEMIEAVGPQYYDTFFGKCSALLRPGGKLLLQAIVMPDQRYTDYLKSVDFIQKYVFPGGSLPSIGALQNSVARATSLRLVGLADFADGYARTLRDWRSRFLDNIDEARALGYSESFLRLWNYYFSYCEGAFEERAVGVVHAVWSQ